MDFGLSRVLEMFEERFGARAAKVLVGLAALALAVLCGKVIINDLVYPVSKITRRMINDWGSGTALLELTQVDAAVFGSLIAVLFCCLGFFVMAKIMNDRLLLSAIRSAEQILGLPDWKDRPLSDDEIRALVESGIWGDVAARTWRIAQERNRRRLRIEPRVTIHPAAASPPAPMPPASQPEK